MDFKSMSSRDPHIRNVMLYEFHRGSNAAEAARNICAVYPNAVSERTVREWFVRFRGNNFSLEDLPKSGHPEELENDALRQLIDRDPKMTSRELGQILGKHHTTVLTHLKSIGKCFLHTVWVPQKLSQDNLLQRITISSSLLARQKLCPFLDRVVTGDEKWILYVNPDNRGQWISKDQVPLTTPKPGLHPRKVMLCVWWDIHGIIYYEMLNMGQTVTAEIYCQQLDRLRQALNKKRPALLNRKGIILHGDNARPHVAKITHEKITEFGWELLPHPPYSPDIAPSDFHLFRSMQHFLKGREFKDKGAIEKALEDFFGSKNEKFFRDGIECLPQRWEKIINNDGNYFIE